MKTQAIVFGLVSGLLVGAGTPTFADDAAKIALEEYQMLGGYLKRPGTQKGRVVYVNCQKRIDAEVLRKNAAMMEKELNFGIDVEEGTFDLKSPAVIGEASLFVVDDPSLPTLLVAPEDRWCAVNMAHLSADGETKLRERAGKEITRGFALLGGAFQSQFRQTLMECVTKPQQLDKYATEKLPFDALIAIGTYLKGYGLHPFEPVSYRDACYEGWAPAPKDDVQKAIMAEETAARKKDDAAKK